MTTFTENNKLPFKQNIVDETYLSINGGKWLPTDEILWLKNYFKNLQENPKIYNKKFSLIAKTSGVDNYRLWFDVDETDDKTEKILDNINMILTKNLVNPDLKCFITKNETTEKKRHLKYKNIYVNNEIQKALIKKINEKIAKNYVDEAARSGCRLDLINKWDKKKKVWINNSRYIKEDNSEMTEEEFINDYNIRKTGEIIEIQEHFKKNVEEFKKKIKNQKSSKITNINLDDLNKNVKLQIQQIEQNERFKNKLCDVNKIGEDYIVHLKQGSFLCPFAKRIHSSNRNYIIIKNKIKQTCLKCHHCEGEFEILNLSFNECLIDDDDDEEEKDGDYFDIDKFLEIQLNEDETENEITKKINEIEGNIKKIEDEIDVIEDEIIVIENEIDNKQNEIDDINLIDTDTLTKQQKKLNKIEIGKKKREIGKKKGEIKKKNWKKSNHGKLILRLHRDIKALEKIQEKNEKDEETLKNIELIKKRIPYFEKYHNKLLSPFCYIEKRGKYNSLYKHTEFTHKNINLMNGDFMKTWLETPHIRSFDKLDFYPPPLNPPERVYNSYTGIRIDNLKPCKDKDFSKITDHIKLMVGFDEEEKTGYNKEGYEYMLNYLAHMVKKIGELPRVALLFKGEEGTGKNIFWNLFGKKILGREYVLETAEMEKVVGRFNMLNQKFIIILDETTGRDSFTNSDKLKNIITQDTIAWEQKGIQGITINNCGRYIFLTNNDTPIKIGMTDRRFVVFEMNPEKKNNVKYFNDLAKSFNDDDVLMSFVDFLQKRNIENWDPIGNRPLTKCYKDLKSVNIPIYARFLIDWCYKNKDAEERTYKGGKLFKLFLTFLEEGNFNIQISISSFGRFIKNYNGVLCNRNSDGIKYIMNTQNIRDGLIKKGFMEKITLKDNCNEGLLINM